MASERATRRMGRVVLDEDGDPSWTPDRSAPEGLVEALAGAVCECGHLVKVHGPFGCAHGCPCERNQPEALAPTVQAYAEKFAAERLAGMETAIREERRRDPSTYNIWSRIDSVLRAVLHPAAGGDGTIGE